MLLKLIKYFHHTFKLNATRSLTVVTWQTMRVRCTVNHVTARDTALKAMGMLAVQGLCCPWIKGKNSVQGSHKTI